MTLTQANISGDLSFLAADGKTVSTLGEFEVVITVSDAAGNTTVKNVKVIVTPVVPAVEMIDDFEGYADTDALNASAWYRYNLPYGQEITEEHDLTLVEEAGNKAVAFAHNSGGEQVLMVKWTNVYSDKHQYIRFQINTQVEKLRLWRA